MGVVHTYRGAVPPEDVGATLIHEHIFVRNPELETSLPDDEWNPAYRKAKRSVAQFELELIRLSRQCASRGSPQAKSGDELVDSYIHNYVLGQTLKLADEAELRNLARLMVDSRLSDRKKQILMLQRFDFNQSAIARRLGIERQAVSKAITSIPEMFRLPNNCQGQRIKRHCGRNKRLNK